MTAAVRQIASIGRDIVRESPNSYSPGYTFFSVPMADDSVRAIRPAAGLHTRHLEEVLGRRAARDVVRGTPLSWDLIG